MPETVSSFTDSKKMSAIRRERSTQKKARNHYGDCPFTKTFNYSIKKQG